MNTLQKAHLSNGVIKNVVYESTGRILSISKRNKFKESPFFILKEPFSSLVNVLEPMSDEYILQAKKDIEDLFYKYNAISVKNNGKHQEGEYVSSEIPDGKKRKTHGTSWWKK